MAERRRIEEEVKWRAQAAEVQFTLKLKAAEGRFKRQLRDVEDRAQRRVQETENRGGPGSQVEQRTTAVPRSRCVLDASARPLATGPLETTNPSLTYP